MHAESKIRNLISELTLRFSAKSSTRALKALLVASNAIASIALTSQVAYADASITFTPTIECGERPKGAVVKKTKIGTELAGPSFTFKRPSTAANNTADEELQKRYILISGSKCWIELFVAVGELEPPSAITTFGDAIYGGPLAGVNSGHTYCFSEAVFQQIYDNSKYDECRALQYPEEESTGNPKTGRKYGTFDAFNKCQEDALAELNSRGFVGYFFDPDYKGYSHVCSRSAKGFVFLDGALIFLEGNKR